MAIRRTCVEVAVGTVVMASTQELEGPCINMTVIEGVFCEEGYCFYGECDIIEGVNPR